MHLYYETLSILDLSGQLTLVCESWSLGVSDSGNYSAFVLKSKCLELSGYASWEALGFFSRYILAFVCMCVSVCLCGTTEHKNRGQVRRSGECDSFSFKNILKFYHWCGRRRRNKHLIFQALIAATDFLAFLKMWFWSVVHSTLSPSCKRDCFKVCPLCSIFITKGGQRDPLVLYQP